MIGFVGSVFSPYYRWARRGGKVDPRRHVGLNVALYGAPARWALTERGAGDLRQSADALRIGASEMRWEAGALVVRIEERCAPLPHRLSGTVRVWPEAVTTGRFAIDAAGRHRWSPLAPRARVEVRLEAPGLRWAGDGYFDCNDGDAPLERDFVRWDWSCARLRRGAGILYDTLGRDGEQRSLALRVAPDGTIGAEAVPPRVDLARTALWRVERRTQSFGAARAVRTLLDAPFYARSVIETEMFGERAVAMHESLSLDRFRTPVVQAMLPFRMPWRARAC